MRILHRFFRFTSHHFQHRRPARAPTNRTRVLKGAIRRRHTIVSFGGTNNVNTMDRTIMSLISRRVTVPLLSHNERANRFITDRSNPNQINQQNSRHASTIIVPVPHRRIQNRLVARLQTSQRRLHHTFSRSRGIPITQMAKINRRPIFTQVSRRHTNRRRHTKTTQHSRGPL